jgi:hypothetical protein
MKGKDKGFRVGACWSVSTSAVEGGPVRHCLNGGGRPRPPWRSGSPRLHLLPIARRGGTSQVLFAISRIPSILSLNPVERNAGESALTFGQTRFCRPSILEGSFPPGGLRIMTVTLWQRYLTQLASNNAAKEFEPVFEAEKRLVWTICARILGAGEEAKVHFDGAGSFSVSGRIHDSIGPWNGEGAVLLECLQEVSLSDKSRDKRYVPSQEIWPEQDGTFIIHGVEPGQYRLRLVKAFDPAGEDVIGSSEPLVVDGQVGGLAVEVWRVPAIAGQVAGWKPGTDPASITCWLQRVNRDGEYKWGRSYKVDEWGRFRIENLESGRYQLRIRGAAQGWSSPIEVDLPASGPGEINVGAVHLHGEPVTD